MAVGVLKGRSRAEHASFVAASRTDSDIGMALLQCADDSFARRLSVVRSARKNSVSLHKTLANFFREQHESFFVRSSSFFVRSS